MICMSTSRFIFFSFFHFILASFIIVVYSTDPREVYARNRDHFKEILLRSDPNGLDDENPVTKNALREMHKIYREKIQPLEDLFRYSDLRRNVMNDADIHSKPIVLVVGPWSTGKTTLINYILGIENTVAQLYTGAEPTTADFTVISYGENYRWLEGVVLATDFTKPFASVEKFGQSFLEHLVSVEMPAPLLRNVTFIDTPGILENRRQQERGYPYSEVMHWLVQRADLILVVFDPTKLDVGYELEALFKRLKGKESVIRLVLNKADSIPDKELIRVYGALFWSLSPLINVTEAPRVYVGSFWSSPYADEEVGELLKSEEKSLLNDLYEAITNRIYNKVASLRHHAILVRLHALIVDSYVTAYRKSKPWIPFKDADLARQIIEDPTTYNVYKNILSHPNVSPYDLTDLEDEYKEFFRFNILTEQKSLNDHRSYLTKTSNILRKIEEAINLDLPKLLRQFQAASDASRSHRKSTKRDETTFDDRFNNYFLRTQVRKSDKEPQNFDTDESDIETKKDTESNISLEIDAEPELADLHTFTDQEPEIKIEKEKEIDEMTFEKAQESMEIPAMMIKEAVENFQQHLADQEAEKIADVEEIVFKEKEKLDEKSISSNKTATKKYQKKMESDYISIKDEQVTIIDIASAANGVSANKAVKNSNRPKPIKSRNDERKCLLYRKSCQTTAHIVAPKDHQAKPTVVIKEVGQEKPKCKLYRKKCYSRPHIEPKSHEKPHDSKKSESKKARTIIIPDQQNQEENCPPYRKTCAQKSEPKIGVKTKDSPILQSTKAKDDKKPAEKCLIYRKSCTSDSSSIKQSQNSGPSDKSESKSGKKPSTATKYTKTKKYEPETVETVKSKPANLKYRKVRDDLPKVEKVSEEVPTEVKKCLPYRKTCKQEQKADQKVPVPKKSSDEISKVSKEATKTEGHREKCPIYRKTCSTPTVEPKTPSVPKKPAPTPKKPQKKADCPPYRKSCIEDKTQTEPKTPSIPKKPAPTPKQPEIKADCPPYRKSCMEGKTKTESVTVEELKVDEEPQIPEVSEKTEPEEASDVEDDGPHRANIFDSDDEDDISHPSSVQDIAPEIPDEESAGEEEEEKETVPSEKEELIKPQQEDIVEIPEKKDKRVISDDCKIYRKSCKVKPKKPGLGVGGGFDYEQSMIFKLIVFLFQSDESSSERTGEKKCLLYRKSCQSSKDNVKPFSIEQPQPEKISIKTTKPFERNATKDEEIKPEKIVKPKIHSIHPSEPEKCLLYRKSCQTSTYKPPEDYVKLKESSDQHRQQGAYPGKSVKDATGPQKCLIYRKSCNKNVAHKTTSRAPVITQEKESVEPDSTKPDDSDKDKDCRLYRKSCQKSPSNSKEDDSDSASKDVVYIIDEKTGEKKKYCKKKDSSKNDKIVEKTADEKDDDSILVKIIKYLCHYSEESKQ